MLRNKLRFLCAILSLGLSGLPGLLHAGPEDTIVVAMLQMYPWVGDAQNNLEKATHFCRAAAKAQADIALMPEMWSNGYEWLEVKDENSIKNWQAKAVAKDGEWVQYFAKLADELDMAIGVTYLEKWDGAPRNSLTVFDRHGKEVFTYAKVHTVDFAANEAATTPGEEWFVETLDTKKGPVELGAMICYDREFPESARILMTKGAELVLTPNACELPDLRIDQFRVRALENAMAFVMTNYPAPYMNGRSVAFDAAAQPLGEAGEEETIWYAFVDMAALRAYRQNTIWGDSYRRTHRYDDLTEKKQIPVFQRKTLDGKDYDPSKR
ncbi:MAG: carbon-nitrogen hydrolase family protein [Puniceicoccaceae bacterium]